MINALFLPARVFRAGGLAKWFSVKQYGKCFFLKSLLHLTEVEINCNGGKGITGNGMRETEHFGCGNFSVVGPLKGKPGKFGYLCLFCGSYRCNRCRNPKLKRVRSEISRIASEKKLNKMATLTLDPKSIPRRYRVRTDRYLRDCWRKMRVSLGRKFGESIDYVGILEFQKNGAAHLHLLVGRFIEQKWLSDAWQAVGGGPIVDIRLVDIHRVTAYLSVYLAGDKVKHTLKLLAVRARIFTTSRSIRLWPKKEKRGWWLRRTNLETFFDAAANPTNVRFEPIEDLKPFALELLSYFESPPLQEAIGNRNVISVLRAAIPVWKAETF